MIDGRKNRKDFMSIVCETYKDFAENTSIHGLKYTVKSDLRLYEKIFWLLVVLAGLIGAGYMTVLFWARYISNPTRTSILTDFAPTTAVAFPAVTICNINKILMSKVENFISQLTIPEGQKAIVERALPQLLAFTDSLSSDYNTSDLIVLHEVLTKNNYQDTRTVMKKISQSCNEMLVKCGWNFTTIPCEELFTETYSTDGHCCSFNYISSYSRNSTRKKPLRTLYNGVNSGLILLLDPMIQPVQYSSLHSSGLKVVIHSSGDYPGSDGASNKIISPGRQTHLQISATKLTCSGEIRRLPVTQRECAYPEEVTLSYFPSYADTNCLAECEERYFYRKCGCVPFYYAFSNKRICNATAIACLDETKEPEKNPSRKCSCISQCEDQFYEIFSTTARLHYNKATETSSFLVNETINEDSIILYVYFSRQTHTILFRDTVTSTIYLLSSFGGVYSLFLGCSFITIVEIIYYCSFRLVVNLKILARIDKTPAPPKSNRVNIKLYDRNIKHHSTMWNLHQNNVFLN